MRATIFLLCLSFLTLGAMAQQPKAKNTTEKTLELRNNKICIKQDLTRGRAIFTYQKATRIETS